MRALYHYRLVLLFVLFLSVIVAYPTTAQTLEDYWSSDFALPGYSTSSASGSVDSTGRITFLTSATVAVWDGNAWKRSILPGSRIYLTDLGEFAPARVFNATVAGRNVYAAAFVESTYDWYVAQWNGHDWIAIARTGLGSAQSFVERGDRLYVSVDYVTLGDTTRTEVIVRDGTTWAEAGGKRRGIGRILDVTGDGTIYVRRFASGVPIIIEWWDGSMWRENRQSTTNGSITFAAAHGGSLYAITKRIDDATTRTAIPARLLRLDPDGWIHVGDTLAPEYEMTTFTFDPSGAPLVAVYRSRTGPEQGAHVVRWNGSEWERLTAGRFDGPIRTLTFTPDGKLYALGRFTAFNDATIVRSAVVYGGQSWSAPEMVGASGLGILGSPNVFCSTPDGLFVGGYSLRAPGIVGTHSIIVLRDGHWSPVPSGFFSRYDTVFGRWQPPLISSIITHPLGGVVVAGRFTDTLDASLEDVAWWDGVSWHAMNDPHITWLEVRQLLDADGTILALGSASTIVEGKADTSYRVLARWSGDDWDVLSFNVPIDWHEATQWNGGVVFGRALVGNSYLLQYRNGSFDSALGRFHVRAPRDTVYSPSAPYLNALEAAGGYLYMGGAFDSVDETVALQIARWDGSSWGALDSGLTVPWGHTAGTQIHRIAASERYVFAYGSFSCAGSRFPGTPRHVRLSSGLAFWDEDLGLWNETQFDGGSINDMILVDDTLWVVGGLEYAAGKSSVGIARFEIPPPHVDPPIAPDTVDFGFIAVGELGTREITIANPPTSTRTTRVRLTDHGGPFGYLGEPWGRIAVGDSITLSVAFYPTEVGTFSDTLFLVTEGLSTAPVPIVLRGTSATTGVTDDRRGDPVAGNRPSDIAATIAPNPTTGVVRITFRSTREGPVRVAIYSFDGQEVALVLDGIASAGEHTIEWIAGEAANGLYLCRVEGEEGSEGFPIVLRR